MRKIGYIQQLQVQTASLKRGEKPHQYYDPAPLRLVGALRLTPGGVIGLVDGQELLDVHHADHLQSKNKNLLNGISFNFTGHYQNMQQRFGSQLALGCAGENILIAANASFAEDAFAQGLLIETQTGQLVHLTNVLVAAPCAPFTEYALNLEMRPPAEMLKAALQFLDGGTRGFYCGYEGEAVSVRTGDTVFLANESVEP
jgi:hypothetical protein